MFKRNTLLAVFALAVAAAPAFGEGNWEVQPFVGYKFGGNIPVGDNDFDFTKIKIDPSVNVGVTAGYNFTEGLGLEFMWNRQPTKAVGILAAGGEDSEKVSVNLDQFMGNFLIHFRDSEEKLRPFILLGFGATRGSGEGSSRTQFSFGVGGGIKYFFTENMGLRLQARYAPTYLYSEPAAFGATGGASAG